MRSKLFVLIVACVAFARLGAGAAHADAISCGNQLVSSGDSMYDVRTRCGVPDMTLARVEYRTLYAQAAGPCFNINGQLRCGSAASQTVPISVEEWTYDFGPHQFVRTLVFEQGV